MSKTMIGRYVAVLNKSKHIQHDFDSFEQAERWMGSAGEYGTIAIVVGEVKPPVAQTSTKSEQLINFAKEIEL